MPKEGTKRLISWRLVLVWAGVSGCLYAVLTISGWIYGWEGPIALTILAVLGFVIAHRDIASPLLHGFVLGFLGGFLAIELQAAFLPTYFGNNPEYELVEIPFGLPARLATAILAPFPATVAGLLTATAVWIMRTLGLGGTARRGAEGRLKSR